VLHNLKKPRLLTEFHLACFTFIWQAVPLYAA